MTESDKAVMQQALDALVDSRTFSKRHGQVIGLLVEAIAQPTQEPNAWRVSGTNRLYDQHEAQQEARRCGGSARAYPVYAEPKPVEPANDKLLQIIAAAYQIAGACDLPFHILDVLANPEKATQEQIDAMLPFVRTEQQKETK